MTTIQCSACQYFELLKQVKELATNIANEADERLRGPTDFHGIEANERHEGRREAADQILTLLAYKV